MTKKLANFLQSGKHLQIIVMLVISCSVLSVIIPPMQSPDEGAHIMTAYMLSRGVVVLDRPEDRVEGKASSGYLDSGLLYFTAGYWYLLAEKRDSKLSSKRASSLDDIKWSGDSVFFPLVGFYFPAVYFPQALGLWVGERLNLTINHSYKLARAFSLCAIALLLYAAFNIYPPNPLVLALLAMPMTMFQMSSASLDGVATALTVFSIAAFLKITTNKDGTSAWVQYAFPLAVAVLASARAHALPILILLTATFFYTKNRGAQLLSAVAGLFILGWTIFAHKTNGELLSLGESRSNIIAFYLSNPGEFFHVVWQTLVDDGVRTSYWKSFIGVLGWLDTSFLDGQYTLFSLFLLIIALMTISFKDIRGEWLQRLLLFSVFAISVLLIFFSLLVTWTPHPAKIIEGIQGRYFLIPAIFLAYGIAGKVGLSGEFRRSAATFVLSLFFMFSLCATVNILIDRYYLVEDTVEYRDIIIGNESGMQPKLTPSAALSQNTPVTLKFPAIDENSFDKITRLCIMFGTYVRKNPGEAELSLVAKGGGVYRRIFSLPELIDNAYKCFEVPADYYTSGELRFVSGGGVSVWEVHADDKNPLSCLKLDTIRNQTVAINGCPR